MLSLGAVLLAAPTAVVATPAAATSDYHVVDLGTLGEGVPTRANAINEHGHIAGESSSHAVLWWNGHITDFGVLPGGTYSDALDLNESDEVVGYSDTASGVHAFIWRHGLLRDLGALPGDDDSVATGINDAGQIVGWSATLPDSNGLHAVRWQDGRPIDMDPGGFYSTAQDTTNNGWIVGNIDVPAASAVSRIRAHACWRPRSVEYGVLTWGFAPSTHWCRMPTPDRVRPCQCRGQTSQNGGTRTPERQPPPRLTWG